MTYTISVRNNILDQIYNAGSGLSISALYVSLHSSDPGNTGTGELSGNGYARQNATTSFPAASSAALANDAVITFGPASGSNWATATYFGFWSASSAGTFYGGFALTTSQTVTVPNTASFAVGDLTAAAS